MKTLSLHFAAVTVLLSIPVCAHDISIGNTESLGRRAAAGGSSVADFWNGVTATQDGNPIDVKIIASDKGKVALAKAKADCGDVAQKTQHMNKMLL